MSNKDLIEMNQSPFSEQYVQDENRKYFYLIWHWTWLIVLISILAGGLAYFISTKLPPIYSTSNRLLVTEASSDKPADYQAVLTSERLTRTYSAMMTNESILQETIDTLSLNTDVTTLRENVTVSPVRDTQLIEVSVEGENPQQIADIANTVVNVFMERINDIQKNRYSLSIESLQTQMTNIEGILEGIQSQIDALNVQATEAAPDPNQINPYTVEKQALDTQALQYQQIYSDLLTSYEQTRLAETQGTSNIIYVNEAVPPTEPIRPKKLVNTLLAAIAAGILSLGTILLINSLDNTIKTPDQIEMGFGLPVLGVIFKYTNKSGVVSELKPLSPTSEAFRSIRTNIQFLNSNENLKTFLITSPTSGTGKSQMGSNLAVMLAQNGFKCVLVDVDLRRPTIHKNFNLSNEKGLTTLLFDPELPVDAVTQKANSDNLSIITSGDLPQNPSELIGSQRMADIVKQLKEAYDLVIFDTPPVLPVADATVLSTLVDGVLIVLQPEKTSFSAARQTIKSLQRMRANIIGVVLNDVKMNGSLYKTYYRHGYGDYKSGYFTK